ncbi:hypothetical protein CTAYLR_001283 [Chrysophaeum taylorii]|uniref:2Fe-2S ferredoxin-type domain-containing protein n=1 Tax=Chrysophaeum taylorii TaxID=2483200 RepID=A0AAD7UEZ9_9STRA|nr:hypothetical protein CTAYLR_001283 [Chrysophaeum taylorii]
MDLIANARGESVELTLGRGVSRVRIEWPNGVGTGAESGASLRTLAAAAMVPVKYSCDSGSCGTCEHKISDDAGEERYARLCVARVPRRLGETISILPTDR